MAEEKKAGKGCGCGCKKGDKKDEGKKTPTQKK
jgi:hypothetical protein